MAPQATDGGAEGEAPYDLSTKHALDHGRWLSEAPEGEEVMITGLAGAFPESRDVHQFRDNLYSKLDMVTKNERRWSLTHPEIPERSGKLFEIEKFDSGYFGVHKRQADSMDPMVRLILEKSVEAIVDAGYHPSELEGTNTGVFVGSSFSETEVDLCNNNLRPQTFVLPGTTRSMISHRVSYHLKLKGVSHNIDTACSSSLYALEHAFRAIRLGVCDRAIVAGVNLCLHPFVTLQFARLGVLSKEGACKVFDVNGDGYARSEAAGVVLLQKSNESRRVYGQIVYAKSNCDGFKPQSINFPSSEAQRILLDEFYQECAIDPVDVSYLEAHGTATLVGDPEEVEAVDEVFCKGRKKPLLVGSVKSNMGHSEPGSGLCSVAKVIITMETGVVPPNLHFTSVREGVDALEKGRLKVINDSTPLQDDRGLMGISSFGFGGANCHVLLRWNSKSKTNHGTPSDSLPRLVCISGRIRDSVSAILDDVKNRKLDAEYVRLYHQVFSKHFPGHLCRGHSILTKSKEVLRSIDYHPGQRKPLFLGFTTFGNSWSIVAKDLYSLPMFVSSIQKIHDVLATKNVNLTEIVLNNTIKEPTIFDHILGDVAVQMAVADIFKHVGLNPDTTFGSGLGEFLCAYFEGCLTFEQTVLCIYQVALTFYKKDKTSVSYLVKVGENELEQLPADVSVKEMRSDGIVITGRTENLLDFRANLVKQGVEVEQLDDFTVNFNSDGFKKIKSQLRPAIDSILSKPKTRPPRWQSTCRRHDFASADYFLDAIGSVFSAGKLLNTSDQVVLEIGNGQLKSEVWNHLSFEGTDVTNSLVVLLKTIGKLYNCGHSVDVARLYPKIDYPVSRNTPMISPLIKWDHSKDWYVVRYKPKGTLKSGERSFDVNLSDDDWAYVAGHVVDGRNLFPATGYLNLVWDAFAMKMGMISSDMQVVFENCRFHRATNVQKDRKLEFLVMIQTGSGNFEVIESDAAIVTGRIYIPQDFGQMQTDLPEPQSPVDDSVSLNSKDVYKELRLRGYNYTGSFKKIGGCNGDGSEASIRWENNWVTFIDNMLQIKILQVDTRSLYVPVCIKQLSIDAKQHLAFVQSFGEAPDLPVFAYKEIDVVKCGGIEIRGLKASPIVKKKATAEPVLEKYQFVPNQGRLSTADAVRVDMQIALENLPGNKVKVVELVDEETGDGEPLASLIHQALSDIPLVQPEVTVLSKTAPTVPNATVADRKLVAETDCFLVVATNILRRNAVLREALGALKDGGFVLSREPLDFEPASTAEIDVLTVYATDKEKLVFARRPTKFEHPTAVDVSDVDEFTWLPRLQAALNNNKNVVAYVQNERLSGILGLVNCIRREPGTGNVKCVFIDGEAPAFDSTNPFYEKQLEKNLGVNVYKDCAWGTYRHLQLEQLQEVENEHCYVNVTVRGDLSSLRWIEGPLRSDSLLPQEQQLIHIYYSAMNFRDIMTASGRISADVITMDRTKQDCVQGFEFSGRTSAGDRVMGMVGCGAQATMVAANIHLTWPVPDDWTLEEAATVPVVYGTLLYSLFMRTKIRAGDSILIHSGSGGVGQAAIRLALHHGCTVFTTVGTHDKREFLKKNFPKLADNHIGNSRDTSFEQMVLSETDGRGVDFVLNSLAEEKLQASVRCLARGGRFLEIGKFDLANDNALQLEFLKKEASFHGIMLDLVIDSTPDVKNELGTLLLKGIRDGAVKPLMRTVFGNSEVEEAFRFMTNGKHMGKVLIKVREEEEEKVSVPSRKFTKGIPRYFCDPQKTFVIVGGLGGFGLELADWLVLRGATKLVLTSRKGISTGYQSLRIRTWKSYGVTVRIATADVTTRQGCEEIIRTAEELGTVEAIFNLAVLLQDAILENQTKETFVASFGPKAYATQYLDEISRRLCPYLRNFVVFSSISCGRGNAGQTNYGMANSVMERICEKRREDGYPALAVEWGAVGDVGIVAEMQEDHLEMEIGGTLQQRISSCLQVLDTLLRQDNAVVSSMVVAEKRGGLAGGDTIVNVTAQILGINDLKTVSHHSALSELGMDSMTAVEIRQTLEREFQVFLSPQDIRNLTFARLQEVQDELSSDGGGLKSDDKPLGGFESLVRVVTDEGEAKMATVHLKTKAKANKNPKVLFFPGIEGIAKSLEPLAQNLNVDGISLQFCYEQPSHTVREISENLLPIVEKFLSKTEPFHFVAYSYGVVVALELVNILESKGYRGHLVCIDGAPEMITTLLKGPLDPTSEVAFETTMLCHIMSFIAPFHLVLEKREQLAGCKNFDERLAVCEQLVPKDSPHTKKHLRDILVGVRKRIGALREYRPSFKLKSSIKLFKPTKLLVEGMPEDYKLSELSQNPVEVKVFQGNHVTVLGNKELAEAIDASSS